MTKHLKPILKKSWRPAAISFGLFLIWWFFFALPKNLFTDPTSTVIEDRQGHLLGAAIASDGQWRFPHHEQVPEKFAKAIIHFEDKRFYTHPGVDPIALGRAIRQNLAQGRVVSGASTLSMQTIRLARKNPARTLPQKALEAMLALRLELRYSKQEILAYYASNAPFGGNIVGLHAASWRYFGRGPDRLSWAETATLAVLPNAPALIHPGKNRELLFKKRNRLLSVLQKHDVIDAETLQLAEAEPLPEKPHPIPMQAPHLLQTIQTRHNGQRIRTSINAQIQSKTNSILQRYHHKLIENGVHNNAALIIHNDSHQVLAYVGNTGAYSDLEHGAAVDIITAPRSTGSLLKPFLHAFAIQRGQLAPRQLLADIPTHFGAYAPKNFDKAYSGATPADLALAQSLNVPSVRLLSEVGTAPFHKLMQQIGLRHISRSHNHYGLAMVLGGAEASMWDLASAYSGLARILLHYEESAAYHPQPFDAPYLTPTETNFQPAQQPAPLQADAVWHTLEALTLVNRPHSQGLWQAFDSARKIAWKTGTSFGFRDAWAIGVTPQYTVAVWSGNADGEGRPGLTGSLVAAPMLFQIFSALEPEPTWFQPPHDLLTDATFCAKSGHLASELCPETQSLQVAKSVNRTKPCPYHQTIFLDPTETFRVTDRCVAPADMVRRAHFILPPGVAWFYRQKHQYPPLPPYALGCEDQSSGNNMALIYPRKPTSLIIPRDLDGNISPAVFAIAHGQPEKTVFWHLNGTYLGSTKTFHQMELAPNPGKHRMVWVDEDGMRLEQSFTVIR